MEYFSTLHIETNKNVTLEEADNEIIKLLHENGYNVLGTVQNTKIRCDDERSIKKCHEAWKNHYASMKNAW